MITLCTSSCLTWSGNNIQLGFRLYTRQPGQGNTMEQHLVLNLSMSLRSVSPKGRSSKEILFTSHPSSLRDPLVMSGAVFLLCIVQSTARTGRLGIRNVHHLSNICMLQVCHIAPSLNGGHLKVPKMFFSTVRGWEINW